MASHITPSSSSSSTVPRPSRVAVCPSCGKHGHFVYSGEQRWPERVARAIGISPVISLWNCESCHSTISEQNLLQ